MGGLQSRFLDNYVMGSATRSYNAQGGQKGHSCLTHCYIFLQVSLITAKAACWREQMGAGLMWTSPLPGQGSHGWIQTTHNTTQPRRDTKHRPETQQWSSSKKKKTKKKSCKTKTLSAAAKAGTDVQLMMQNWDRRTQEVIHLVRGNTFTHKELCFQPDSSLCAHASQTEWLHSAIPTWGVLFGLPRWCKKMKTWGMQQRGKPVWLTVCPNSAHKLRPHNPDLFFI